jgi:hypothetical protein
VYFQFIAENIIKSTWVHGLYWSTRRSSTLIWSLVDMDDLKQSSVTALQEIVKSSVHYRCNCRLESTTDQVVTLREELNDDYGTWSKSVPKALWERHEKSKANLVQTLEVFKKIFCFRQSFKLSLASHALCCCLLRPPNILVFDGILEGYVDVSKKVRHLEVIDIDVGKIKQMIVNACCDYVQDPWCAMPLWRYT